MKNPLDYEWLIEREVDWLRLDVLGRLSGSRYCAVRSVIEGETN